MSEGVGAEDRTTDALIEAMERALLAFGARNIVVDFSDDAPEGRASLTIAFYPGEFAYKVGMMWDGQLGTGDDDA